MTRLTTFADPTRGGSVSRETGERDAPMPGRTIAILQSNYIPWKGYFDLIRRVDEFILYDEVQYTRRDWRNRNRIKTAAGVRWLTIPVEVSGRFEQTISETLIADPAWAGRHWKTLQHSYGRAAGFAEVAPRLETFYAGLGSTPRLSEVNEALLRIVCEMLDLEPHIRQSSEFDLHADDATSRLVSICAQAGATRYLSGPAARAYLDETKFNEAGIEVDWMSYDGYPQYTQLHGVFDHHVSIVDLLFNMGRRAKDYLLPSPRPYAEHA